MKAKFDIKNLFEEIEKHGFAVRNHHQGKVKFFHNEDGEWLGTARVCKSHGNQHVRHYYMSHWWPNKVNREADCVGINLHIGFRTKRK